MNKWDRYRLIDSPYLHKPSSLTEEDLANGWISFRDDHRLTKDIIALVVLGSAATAFITLGYLLLHTAGSGVWIIGGLSLVTILAFGGFLWNMSHKKVSKWILSHQKLEFEGQTYYWREIMGIAAYENHSDGLGKYVLVISPFEADEETLDISLSLKNLRKFMEASQKFLEMNEVY